MFLIALLALLQSEPPPIPVVLVPGWNDRASRFNIMRARFEDAGWPPSRIAVVEFRNRWGGNAQHAREIARTVQRLKQQTGATRVDVVAHSMGGLATRYYLHYGGGASHVRRVVFMATPHRGTWLARLAPGAGARDMRPGSPLLDSLALKPSLPLGIEAMTIQTSFETRIWPHTSATLPAVKNIRICCPTHPQLLRHPRVFEVIRTFLKQ